MARIRVANGMQERGEKHGRVWGRIQKLSPAGRDDAKKAELSRWRANEMCPAKKEIEIIVLCKTRRFLR